MTDDEQPLPQLLETLGQQLESVWSARLDLWKHITIVEATVLGLTIGLLSVSSGHAGPLLLWAWVALLVAIVLGCVLVECAVSLDERRKELRFAHVLDAIRLERWTKELRIQGAEADSLWRASAIAVRGDRLATLSPEERQIAEEFIPRLPSRVEGVMPKHRVAVRTRDRIVDCLKVLFYGVSLAAFALLLASVVKP